MRKRPTRMAFNNTSMLDVIFIILIFFVSVSRLREGAVNIRLPGAEQGPKTEAAANDDLLVVSLDAADRLHLNGKALGGRGELAGLLRAEKARKGEDRRVVFQADRESSSGALVTALKTVSEEGFRNVAFEYEPRPEVVR